MRHTLLAFVSTSLLLSGSLHAQWVRTNGPGGSENLALTASGKYLFVGTFFGAGIMRTSDSGTTWTNANNGLSGSIGATVVHSIFVSGTKLFAGTGDGIYSSTNNGNNWKIVSSGLPSGTQVTSFAMIGSNLFAGTSVGVILSTNTGTTWKVVSNGLTNLNVECLLASSSNLFAGTDNGVALSTDSGANWTPVTNGLTDTITRTLAVIDNAIFVGTYAWPDTGSAFRSTDNGSNWTKVSNGLQPAEVRALVVSGTNLFAGIDSGVYLTTNNGTSWKAVNAGLTGLAQGYPVSALVVYGENLFAGTDTVWRRPLSEMIVQSSVIEPPRQNDALDIYPNPLSRSTTITFTPQSSGFANISIVNLLGTEVVHLYSGELAAGEHTFTWEPTALPDGMYECVVRMNGSVDDRSSTVQSVPILLQR